MILIMASNRLVIRNFRKLLADEKLEVHDYDAYSIDEALTLWQSTEDLSCLLILEMDDHDAEERNQVITRLQEHGIPTVYCCLAPDPEFYHWAKERVAALLTDDGHGNWSIGELCSALRAVPRGTQVTLSAPVFPDPGFSRPREPSVTAAFGATAKASLQAARDILARNREQGTRALEARGEEEAEAEVEAEVNLAPAAAPSLPPEEASWVVTEVGSDSPPEREPVRRSGRGSSRVAVAKEGFTFPERDVIGVFALSRGAGATYTSLKIAEYLVRHGNTALLAFDGKQDVKWAAASPKLITICPENAQERANAIAALYQDYRFIVIDFGTPFILTPTGLPDETAFSQNAELLTELIRCNRRVCLAFDAPWHAAKKRFVKVMRLDTNLTMISEGERNLSPDALLARIYPGLDPTPRRGILGMSR